MSDSQKRQRSKIACEPCRERKRKCDGSCPCLACRRFSYACNYEPQSRKSIKAHPRPNPDSTPEPLPTREASSPEDRIRSVEANSGIAFVRRLGLKIDPVNAPKQRLFSWNIGRHSVATDGAVLPLMDMISQTDMKSLAMIYFEKFHSLYGIIDREAFFENLEARWSDSTPIIPYDAVLSSVAALGYLYSHRRATLTEKHLVETARFIIESNSSMAPPSVDIVTALALRVAYLRLTDRPYVAWMASCSLMHMIEETGLHLEPSSQTILARSAHPCEPNFRRRLCGFSQHLHVWMAFDLGRTRVKLQGASNVLPLPEPGNSTTEILGLLPFSESLDPEESKDPRDLEKTILAVLAKMFIHPAAIFAQCNVVLCIYRRLRAAHWSIPGQVLRSIFDIMDKTLAAVRKLVDECCPWFGIANVSFQIICSLLAIDNSDSMSRLENALLTLRSVVTAYDTEVMKEAYRTASILVMLYYQKKNQDLRMLEGSVREHCMLAIGDTEPKSSSDPCGSQPQSQSQWMEDLASDMPELRTLDFEQFLFTELSWMPPE